MEIEKSTAKKKPIPAKIKELMDDGIPLRKVIFNKSVLSWKNEPEFAFYAGAYENKVSRKANIWFTPVCIVCQQGDMIRLIPHSNVYDTEVL